MESIVVVKVDMPTFRAYVSKNRSESQIEMVFRLQHILDQLSEIKIGYVVVPNDINIETLPLDR